jgi:hypothetical protein
MVKINEDRVLVVKPGQGPFGKPIRSWEENIKVIVSWDGGTGWFYLPHNRDN